MFFAIHGDFPLFFVFSGPHFIDILCSADVDTRKNHSSHVDLNFIIRCFAGV